MAKFISVDEKLPEYDEEVLIVISNQDENEYFNTSIGWLKSTDVEGHHWREKHAGLIEDNCEVVVAWKKLDQYRG